MPFSEAKRHQRMRASNAFRVPKPAPPRSSWWTASTRADFMEAAKARDAEMGWSGENRATTARQRQQRRD